MNYTLWEMTSERLKCHDFLALVFISKSISNKQESILKHTNHKYEVCYNGLLTLS